MIYIYTNKTEIRYAEFNLKEVLIQIHYPKLESKIYILIQNLYLEICFKHGMINNSQGT